MVPYIHVPDLHIGPLPLHPFGILVATGVLVGTSITTRRARKLGYDVVQLNSFITWMLVVGVRALAHARLALLPLGRGRQAALVGPHALGGAELLRRLRGRRRRDRRSGSISSSTTARSCCVRAGVRPQSSRSPISCSRSSRSAGSSVARVARRSTITLAPARRPTRSSRSRTRGTRATAPSRSSASSSSFTATTRASISAFSSSSSRSPRRVLRAYLATPSSDRDLRHRVGVGLRARPVRDGLPAHPGERRGRHALRRSDARAVGCMVLFLYSFLMIFYVRSLQKRGVDLSQSLREPPEGRRRARRRRRRRARGRARGESALQVFGERGHRRLRQDGARGVRGMIDLEDDLRGCRRAQRVRDARGSANLR